MISVEVQDLTRVFAVKGKAKKPVVANDRLTFTVKRGEIFGLLGPNGAGKTTLIYQLLGLLRPTSGSICVEGIDVVKYPQQIKNLTSFLPQNGVPMQFIELEQALYFTGRLRGQNEHDAKQQVQQMLVELGMTTYAKSYVHKLSGGQLRLANFAMTLMGWPKVLVLDEPTNELDPANRKLVWDMLARLNRERGVTCILVTHNVLEAEKVIQRVAVMQAGRIVALGTPGELKLKANDKVRLEFSLKENEKLTAANLNELTTLAQIEEPRPGQYRLYLSNDQVTAATELVVKRLGLANLDDFRLAPPSLEDVYLNLKTEEVA